MTDTKYRFIIVELFISLILLNTCSYPLAKAEEKMNSDYEIAVAKMPETPPKPALDLEKAGEIEFERAFDRWWTAKTARIETVIPYREKLDSFIQSSTEVIFRKNKEENLIYSPINLWFALHLLSSISANSSHNQIVSSLSADNQEQIDEIASALWVSQYWNDGQSSCIPNASIWLAKDILIAEKALERITEVNHASIFQGEMGSKGLNQAFQSWINRNTKDLFHEITPSMELDRKLTMGLFTTLFYGSNWSERFYSDFNEEKEFHLSSGNVIKEYMCQSCTDYVYYGKHFSAYIKPMEDGKVVFFLPDNNAAPELLFEDREVFSFLTGGYYHTKCLNALVHFSMPKLDLYQTLPLKDCMEEIGISEIFSPAFSDFSAFLINGKGSCISDVSQYNRIIMNEEGVTAASITKMLTVGAAIIPDQEIDFCLDRPFAFAILGQQDVPLFLGVIYQP